eukprot:6177012-Pleurochrysis_carterae.AAC.3
MLSHEYLRRAHHRRGHSCLHIVVVRIAKLVGRHSRSDAIQTHPICIWVHVEDRSAVETPWFSTAARELADLLRGRPELSHSVLQGVYETFTRRLRQAAAEDGQVSADWLLAADLDKSPMLKRQLSSKRADWKATIAAVPRQDL